MEKEKIEEAIEAFKIVRPEYENLTARCKSLIEDVLRIEKIKYHAIEVRTKSIESFSEKINSKAANYKNPLEEVTDLCGIRVIAYYDDDVVKISELIRKEFRIDEKNSIDKSKLMNSNEFGYLSIHLVGEITNERKKLTEWRQFKGHKIEIQVRTVLQHAWASISHALQYKSKDDVPSELKRKLFRLAGLFELADEQFLEIRDSHEETKKSVQSIKEIQTTDAELNLLTLKQYLSESTLVLEIKESARKAGFEINDDFNDDYGYASESIPLLKELGILMIKDLDVILKKRLQDSFEYFQSLKEGISWVAGNLVITELIVLLELKERISIKLLVDNGWGNDMATQIVDVVKKFN
jgi:putative GTP pyrophosphokinase